MKVLFLLTSFLLPFSAFSDDRKLHYVVEKGDTFGSIILSLGYLKLWSGSAYVNKFKNKVQPRPVSKVSEGDKIFFNDSEIIFKDNVKIDGERIHFIKKIKKKKQWSEHMAAMGVQNAKSAPAKLTLEKKDSTVTFEQKKWNFDLYSGLGLFTASDVEIDRSTQTSTSTGFQPMAQVKGIYSHHSIGSLAFDILAKQILNSEFSFPLNTDFRFQYIPKWIDLNVLNLAVSYSMLRHSYVGKPLDEEIEYELKSSFIGIGLVWPKERYWYELYIEKAVGGKTRSDEQEIALNEGWRVDSELIYPLTSKLRLIPGINYYSTKNSSLNYQMKVLELRSTLVWEVNL